MKQNKYIAFTLGPVVKTILQARHTRELWASSYLFSYLVKRILKAIIDNGLKSQILSPYVSDDAYFLPFKEQTNEELKEGAGLFPDRIFFKVEKESDFDVIVKCIDSVFEDFANDVAQYLKKDEKAVLQYFKSFFHYYLIEKDLGESGTNPILAMSPYLQSVELQTNFVQEEQSYLTDFLDRINNSFLAHEAFGEKHSFETIVEIATREFQDKEAYKAIRKKRISYTNDSGKEYQQASISDDEDLINQLKKSEKDKFKVAHKYIAIVHADGDKITKILETLKDDELQEFSLNMKTFALRSVAEIKRVGGISVYAGGDDLLFFTPVVNGKDNVFALCERLNSIFKDIFKEATLSFGISISYYKHPLYEALKISLEQLFEKAKNEPKNQIALHVQKHSGQTFHALINQSSLVYTSFKDLLSSPLGEEDEFQLLSSVMYKIRGNEAVWKEIGTDAKQIINFIDNSFNEDVHKKPLKKAYLDKVKVLIEKSFSEQTDKQLAIENTYGILRTVAFLNNLNL
jgi:CRISPR-associated protein Cmr2